MDHHPVKGCTAHVQLQLSKTEMSSFSSWMSSLKLGIVAYFLWGALSCNPYFLNLKIEEFDIFIFTQSHAQKTKISQKNLS